MGEVGDSCIGLMQGNLHIGRSESYRQALVTEVVCRTEDHMVTLTYLWVAMIKTLMVSYFKSFAVS